MKVILDIDGVIAQFDPLFAGWVEDNYGYEPVPVDDWSWFENYPNGEVLWKEFFEPHNLNAALVEAELQQGAFDGLSRLYRRGHDIEFATYRPAYSLEATYEWLNTALGISDPVIHHVKDKGSVPGDFYLDDHGPTVQDLRERGLNAYLYDQPWNLEYDLPRCRTWLHVIKAVDSHVNDD